MGFGLQSLKQKVAINRADLTPPPTATTTTTAIQLAAAHQSAFARPNLPSPFKLYPANNELALSLFVSHHSALQFQPTPRHIHVNAALPGPGAPPPVWPRTEQNLPRQGAHGCAEIIVFGCWRGNVWQCLGVGFGVCCLVA